MNNLLKRAITGSIYVLSVIAAIFIHPIVTSVYFFIIAMIGLWEFYNISSKQNDIKPDAIIGYLIAIATYIAMNENLLGQAIAKAGLFSALILLFVLTIAELYRKSEKPFSNIAYTVLSIIYIVVPLGCVNIIMDVNSSHPQMILMSVFIFAWANDTFAYLTGMKFGKHKLLERISPKKTWEGWIGGFVFTIIAAIVISKFSTALPIESFIAVAVITSVIGTFGDLVESMLKRQVGVKDSGNILPGHGGVLDRFDILLLVLPAVTLLFVILQ